MYYAFIAFLGLMMLGLGLFMVISPRNATKAEERDNEQAVASVKKRGFIIVACGIVVVIIGIISMFTLR